MDAPLVDGIVHDLHIEFVYRNYFNRLESSLPNGCFYADEIILSLLLTKYYVICKIYAYLKLCKHNVWLIKLNITNFIGNTKR